jgi:acetyltransferase-like isoleucine patch superfamily enzyme
LIDALSKESVKLGQNVTIAYDTKIVSTGLVRNPSIGVIIKDNCAIGASSFISCKAGIEIGKNVIMGAGVMIFSENHNSDFNFPIKFQCERRDRVTIGENCWIGSGSIILAGVNLGSRVVVAAGTIVTKSFESNGLTRGVPAKILMTI